MKAKEVFESFKKLTPKEKIEFEELKNQQDRDELEAEEYKKIGIATDLLDSGISEEWIKNNII